MKLRDVATALVLATTAAAALPAAAQSADQEVVSAVDAPDPVTPGATLTYTVTATNHGPDPAVGGGINVNLPNEVALQNTVAPAGFTCNAFGNNLTCNAPSMAVGTYLFTINTVVGAHLANFPDASIAANFFPSGTTIDPNGGNNLKTATTTVDSAQVDLVIAVSDSPDPVFPDGTITYTAQVSNAGPDAASNVNFNVFNNGSLRFQSVSAPAGFGCTLPAVGAAPTFTCTAASVPAGFDEVFTVVVLADDAVLGINDGTVQTAFGINGTGNDTAPGNNDETESTQYVTPDADVSVSVSDSPDPVFPDGDITYTVTVANSGPDTAENTVFNVFNNGSLRFQSISAPAGFSCSPPAVGGVPTFSCTHPSFANGAMAVFTLVVEADATVIGANDTTVSSVFGVSSGVSDPDPTDNSETENTAYVAPDADLSVSVVDAPDPVGPDGTLVYTATVANAGPDAAANTTFSVFNNGSLQFQSVVAPPGFTCTPPAVGAAPTFSCTHPSFASGANAVFTLTTHAEADALGSNDGTISSSFTVSSAVADPDGSDNSENEDTAYVAPDADLSVSASGAPASATAGDDITYTVTLQNAGPDAAANAQFSAALVPQLRFVSLVPPAGFSCTTPAVGASGTVSCSAASFAAAGNVVLTLVAQLDPAVTGSGSVSQVFTLTSGTADPDGSDNQASVVTPYANPQADLTIAKTTTAANVTPGGTISYAIVVTNAGPDAAQALTVTDVLPATLRFASLTAPAGFTCTTPAAGANGTVTCTAATLANGSSATLQLVTTVAPDATGTVANSAMVTAATPDPDPQDNGSTAGNGQVIDVADLRLTKTLAAPAAPMLGTVVVYTLTVTNDGPSSAANVAVTDALPAGLELVSAVPSRGSCSGQAVVNCTLGTLANGASATIVLQARIVGSQSPIVNSASVQSAAGDPDATDNTASAAPLLVTLPAVPTQPAVIPVDAAWMLALLAMLLGGVAVSAMRRR